MTSRVYRTAEPSVDYASHDSVASLLRVSSDKICLIRLGTVYVSKRDNLD